MIKQRTELNFGLGSIRTAVVVHSDGIGSLFCYSSDPKPIGTSFPIDEYDIDDSEVLMTFNSVESVDNIINLLNDLRDLMIAHKEADDILDAAAEQLGKKYMVEVENDDQT